MITWYNTTIHLDFERAKCSEPANGATYAGEINSKLISVRPIIHLQLARLNDIWDQTGALWLGRPIMESFQALKWKPLSKTRWMTSADCFQIRKKVSPGEQSKIHLILARKSDFFK